MIRGTKCCRQVKVSPSPLEPSLAAWDAPTDWDDLSLYGFYCLENAVEAAAKHLGIQTSRKHWEKAELAGELHDQHGLPDVEQLLRDLNEARKAAAYGDVEGPDLDAEEIAMQIELTSKWWLNL